MSTVDSYEGFADRYDLFPPDPAARAFYQRLFSEHRVRKVLDCACGTGRDLITFRSLGCDVVGSDRSPTMLAQARSNLARAGIETPLQQIDYRDLPDHFDQEFHAVTCLGGSLLEASGAETSDRLTVVARK